MSKTGRIAVLVVGLATVAVAFAAAQNHAPNPYRAVDGWGRLPAGRTWGATSAVFPAQDGSGNIWVGERCGENLCADKPDVDPILLFDNEGNLLDSFGAGVILWPHGMFVDSDNNVWVTDAVGAAARGGAQLDKGHTVLKFSPSGELLMTVGTPGVSGAGTDTFNQPSDVLVAPDGSIFVADGHGAGGNNRIVKFASDGTFLLEWGETGRELGQFRDPHALALDAEGRLYVGDRDNSRIQIFTQEGEHIATWTQFGRPSGLFIDAGGILYSTDSESNARRNQGWKRGIRIGSVSDGLVTAFIPDPEPDQDNSGTSAGEGVAVDAMGNVYSAEVGPRMMRKFVKR